MSSKKTAVVTSVTNLDEQKKPYVILEFENATPQGEPEVEILTDPKTKKKELTMNYKKSREDHEDRTYRGIVGDGYPTDLTRTYLAIRNKKTKEVRFVEVEQCRVKSLHHTRKEPEAATKAIDARSILLKNFGSKKAARSIDRKEKTAYNSDIVKDQIDEAVDTAFNNTMDEDTMDGEDDADVAPPCNKEASKASDAYKLDQIIPLEVLQALETPALSLIEMKAMHLPFTTPFILNLVKSVQLSGQPDSKYNLNKLKIAIYCECLVNMLNTHSKIITNNEIPEIAKSIQNHIKETFGDKMSQKPIKSRYTKQKALCYYVVLAFLTTNDFNLGYEALFEGVKVTKTEAIKFARFIGAVYQIKSDKFVLKLKSQLPKLESSYRKRKRNSI